MSGRQWFAIYLGLNGLLLLWFAIWATRKQWLFDRAAQVVPAEFIGWRETERQGRANRDVLIAAIYRYLRDARPQEVQARAFRSRISSEQSGPPGWPWRPAQVVRYVPDGGEKAQVGRASAAWAGLLLTWSAGLALVATAIALLRQG
jgi:hypothetical protein